MGLKWHGVKIGANNSTKKGGRAFLPSFFILCHHQEQNQHDRNTYCKYTFRAYTVKRSKWLFNIRLPCPVLPGLVRVFAPGEIILTLDIFHKD